MFMFMWSSGLRNIAGGRPRRAPDHVPRGSGRASHGLGHMGQGSYRKNMGVIYIYTCLDISRYLDISMYIYICILHVYVFIICMGLAV